MHSSLDEEESNSLNTILPLTLLCSVFVGWCISKSDMSDQVFELDLANENKTESCYLSLPIVLTLQRGYALIPSHRKTETVHLSAHSKPIEHRGKHTPHNTP